MLLGLFDIGASCDLGATIGFKFSWFMWKMMENVLDWWRGGFSKHSNQTNETKSNAIVRGPTRGTRRNEPLRNRASVLVLILVLVLDGRQRPVVDGVPAADAALRRTGPALRDARAPRSCPPRRHALPRRLGRRTRPDHLRRWGSKTGFEADRKRSRIEEIDVGTSSSARLASSVPFWLGPNVTKTTAVWGCS